MIVLRFRIRTIAVYRVVPSDCLRARIVAMVASGCHAIDDTYMAPLQLKNSPECPQIPQKRLTLESLKK
jgi:hypothetical protein